MTYQWFAFESPTRSLRYGYGTAEEAAEYLTYLRLVYGPKSYAAHPLTDDAAGALGLESGQVLRCYDLTDALEDIRERTHTTILNAVEAP